MPAAAAPSGGHRPTGRHLGRGHCPGRGTTLYAGDLFAGDIFRGDVQRGTAELFIDAPAGRMAVGMAADLEHDLLFVAGGFTGQGYVYDTRTGATVAIYQFGTPAPRWSPARDGQRRGPHQRRCLVYRFVPAQALLRAGQRGRRPGGVPHAQLTGPAAEISGQFNLNGIQATPNGKTLIVAHSTNGELYTVNPLTGASATIAGVSVPSVDGIVLLGRRLWAVQNSNQVTRVQLSPHLTSGVIEEVITSELFQVPATAARFGSRLAVVNAKFDTGFPPMADEWEVVVIDR